MKKIAMFAPYFGNEKASFPNYFEYWQKSAAANQGVEFFIPTNLEFDQYQKYGNIHFIKMSAEVFWNKLQCILDFPISHNYYKTGEYRIFFGIIFSDILKDYDYWGMTEFDMIYGNILKFIQPYLDSGAEVIGKTAPFRLLKNTDRINQLPFAQLDGFAHPLTLETAFSTDYCWFFSEIVGMNVRYMQAGIDIASIDSFFGDISTKFKYLSCIGVKGMWGFTWKDGELIGYNNFHEKREFMAIHLQKRKLAIDHALPKEKFCIVPNEILNGMENCMKIKKNSLFYTIDRMRKTYLKIYRDNQQIGEEGKLIKDELYSYCTVNGLFPPKKSGKLLTPLYALKRKFFWT